MKKCKRIIRYRTEKGKRSFKKRLEEGETLDDILPEAFAVVREALVPTY